MGQLQPLGAYEPGLAGQPFQRAGVDRSLFPLGLQPTPYEAPIGQFAASRPPQIGQFAANPMTKMEFARRLGPLYSGEPTGTLYSKELGRRVPFEPRQSLGLMFPEQGPIVSRPDLLQPVDPTNNIFRGTQLNAPTVGFTDVSAPVAPGDLNVTAGGAGDGGRGLFPRTRDYLVRGGQTPKQVQEAQNQAYNAAYTARLNSAPINMPRADAQALAAAAGEQAAKSAGPGLLAKYGPSTALGLGAVGLFGGFDEGEEPEAIDYYDQMYGEAGSAQERLRNNPGMYSVGIPTRAYTPATLDDIRYSAMGGPINQNNFPPRIGPISGPGTGTSDDVPAMLSDGEYVMTAKAVRGAGNGNRKQGMRNMYNMMRQFEGQAV